MNTSSSSEDDDPLREARAYNQSIYLMVAMPYLLLGAVGLMVYRGIKAADKRTQARLGTENMEARNDLLDDRETPESSPEIGRE